MKRLDGRCAVVTGAARGLGFAIAQRLAAEGARVLMSDIDEPALAAAARTLGQDWQPCDVSRAAEVARLVDAAAQRHGRLDILVNNAGILRRGALLELTEEVFDQVMAVNLKSALFATQAAARHMIPRRSGSIVNLSSVNAVVAMPDQIPYAVSKAALKQLTNVTALALAPHGIRVNAIGPGTVMTDMARAALGEDAQAAVLARTPLGRLGRPEEVAAIAAFLASDDASYVTGQTLYADGGRLGLNYTMPARTD